MSSIHLRIFSDVQGLAVRLQFVEQFLFAVLLILLHFILRCNVVTRLLKNPSDRCILKVPSVLRRDVTVIGA